ncbi:GNAT family N-acetyltransferase [Frisingicoccus sp.]|uniref:GNAT family N-acetyltransferase n=1 Tax=Frisingicoccus sp. TaxID=1918627 RepID=UPI003AB24456
MMIFELEDTSKAESLFAGWEETLIYSCIEKVMGKILVTDINVPRSACAYVGCFAFYAGEPDKKLLEHKPDGFIIMVPQNEEWAHLIEKCLSNAKRISRYAIRKNTQFDVERLQNYVKQLPEGYELKEIDGDIYDRCIENPAIEDFVSSFENKLKYLECGRGMVIMKDGEIVAGASSYTRYKAGIEIQVDTLPSERRKHLATIACSALILKCLEENLYPSWDAQNMNSVRLAEKLGYEFAHEYTAYEVGEAVNGVIF